jgi:type I restriction enzyme S subunit
MVAEDWEKVTLGDLIDIKHGFAFQGQFFRDDPPGDILLTPGNFAIGGGFKSDKFKYYVGPVPDDFILEEGTLLVTMTDLSKDADTLGYPAIVPKTSIGRYLHNQRLGKVQIHNDASLRKDFLYYLLRTREYRHEVLSSATGTTVKHTSPDRIMAFKFRLPPLPEQKAIASMLGALDDKIELNRKMNETIEAMARAIFKSWFVDFDPIPNLGHHKEWQDSPLGKIPKGWIVAPVSEVFEINPSREIKKGIQYAHVDMASLPTTSARVINITRREFTGSGSKFKNGDVLFSRITPCLENGKTALVDFLPENEYGWGSTEFIVFSPKEPLNPWFVYCIARTPEFRDHAIRAMSGTSGRQRVEIGCFDNYSIVVPPPEIVVKFGDVVKPWFAQMKANDEQSHTLAAIRDTLLPKLLSGEIRVKDVESFMEPAS